MKYIAIYPIIVVAPIFVMLSMSIFAPLTLFIASAFSNNAPNPPTSLLFTITSIAIVIPTVINRTCIRFAAVTDLNPPTIV